MSEANAAPDTAPVPGTLSADAGSTGSVLGLGGATAAGDAGTITALDPNAGVTLPNVDPVAPPAMTSQSTVGGVQGGEAGIGGTLGATEEPDVMPEVIATVNAIEQLALFWGGETGTKIRNHVGRLRALLQA